MLLAGQSLTKDSTVQRSPYMASNKLLKCPLFLFLSSLMKLDNGFHFFISLHLLEERIPGAT